MEKKMGWKRIALPFLKGLTIVYGLCCLYLYLQQAVQPLDYNNRLSNLTCPIISV